MTGFKIGDFITPKPAWYALTSDPKYIYKIISIHDGYYESVLVSPKPPTHAAKYTYQVQNDNCRRLTELEVVIYGV